MHSSSFFFFLFFLCHSSFFILPSFIFSWILFCFFTSPFLLLFLPSVTSMSCTLTQETTTDSTLRPIGSASSADIFQVPFSFHFHSSNHIPYLSSQNTFTTSSQIFLSATSNITSIHHCQHFTHLPTHHTTTGYLLSVNPRMADRVPELMNANERVLYVGTWPHGFFSMSLVGATNVGSIEVYTDPVGVLFTPSTALFTLSSALFTLSSALFTLSIALFTLSNALFTLSNALFIHSSAFFPLLL